jgi:hypothetical protein
MQVANLVVSMLIREGVHENAAAHIWDRLVDGLSRDSDQELASLYGMLQPDDPNYIFIKDGKVSSPKEPGTIAYRRV